VVAVSFASVQLHHMAAENHLGAGVLGYLMVFFAIWWCWMNFSWFGTSFDTDDWLYRILAFIQMAGVLVLASGAAAAMEEHDFTAITIGYAIMRLALVTQWIRVALGNPQLRATALRYAVGISAVQLAWFTRLLLPETAAFIGFFVLVAAEISVPIWAESRRRTPSNPHHITERYGLFTLILLGESILASANAVVESLHTIENLGALMTIAACALITAAGMWWIYFSRGHHHMITSLRSSLAYGYSHYVIFAAAGTLSVPVSLFALGIWLLILRRELSPARNAVFLAGVAIILAGTFLASVLPVAAVAAGIILCVASTEHRPAAGPGLAVGAAR